MSLLKKGIKDSFVYGIGLVAARLAGFATLPFLVRTFDPSEYAFIALVLSIVPITKTMLALEVCQAKSVFFSDSDNIEDKAKYFSTGLWFSCLVVLVFSLLFLACLKLEWFGLSAEKLGLSLISALIICIALFFDCAFTYCLSILRWTNQTLSYVMISVFTAWATVALIIINVSFFDLGLTGVFIAWSVSWMMAFFLALVRVRAFIRFSFSSNYLGKMLHFSFPLFVNNIPDKVNSLADRYIILFLLNSFSMGLYAATFTFASIAGTVGAVLQTALWPLVYKAAVARKDGDEISKLFMYTLLLMALVLLSLTFVNKPLLTWILSEEYTKHSEVILMAPLLMASALISSLTVFFPGMAVARKNKYVIYVSVIALLTNIVLSILGLYIWGILGVAIGLFVSAVVRLIAYAMFSQKFYKQSFDLAKLLKYCFIFLLLELTAFYVDMYSPSSGWQAISARLAIPFVIFLAIFWLGRSNIGRIRQAVTRFS
mgnify:CR=1 FL=1